MQTEEDLTEADLRDKDMTETVVTEARDLLQDHLVRCLQDLTDPLRIMLRKEATLKDHLTLLQLQAGHQAEAMAAEVAAADHQAVAVAVQAETKIHVFNI